MFKDLQKLFRQTWSSFRFELGRREPEDEVAELLSLMRREIVDARALLPEFEESIRAVEQELTKERRALADCERRASLAQRIDDAETERIANEFAARHRDHIAVLEQKRAAAIAERDLRQREVEQMTQRFREAETNRFALVAELRRQRAASNLRDALSGSGGAFGDFARMEESIQENEAYADALHDLDDPEPRPQAESAIHDRIHDLEERLNELKRRMGKG